MNLTTGEAFGAFGVVGPGPLDFYFCIGLRVSDFP
jgi:hypothetical protein